MEKKINELSQKLLEKILQKYHNRPDLDKRSLSQMIDDELKNYNESVKGLIEAKMYEILGGFYFENTNREIAVTPVLLSDMLYKNAKDVSRTTTKILRDGIKAKKTINELARELYEGYGFREKEPLDLIDKYALPKYIKNELTRPKNIKKVMKQIEKLKTKPLRIAYKNIFRELDKMSYEGLQKALYVATQEKARYYANRIAQTEIHRASMSKWAKEMLEDDEVEFVKYRLSTAHKIKDICDFYAHLDLGYGPGIYPKKEMRTLPLHPHCSCVYDPYYREVKGKRKPWDKAVKETMEKFSEYEQRQILGSKDMLARFKKGEDIEKIFNILRPKYPIRKYVDVFGKMSKNLSDIKNMKYKSLKEATKEEIEVVKSWTDFYECKNIRAVFYGENSNPEYVKKAQILDEMFYKYDSFLDKNEPIYRGIRFEEKEIFDKFIHNAYKNLNKEVEIDNAPSSFSRSKKVAYKEFGRADSDEFYSVIFILKKRKKGELYIKDYAGEFAYQEEIIIKSHKSKYKIIDIKRNEEYNKTYEIIIEEI